MSKHYYKCRYDTRIGKQIDRFLLSCARCENEAERYAKKMGGQYYYDDPSYFAGGVTFISFPDNKPSDPGMWREVGVQHKDGSFTSVLEPEYHGAVSDGDVLYFEPNVHKQVEWVEVDNVDTRPSDTFDCIYSPMPHIKKTDKDGREHFFIQRVRFVFSEASGRSGNGQRVASRTVRRAIKAELKRKRLPTIGVEPLLTIFGADTKNQTVKNPTTPTLFLYEDYYFIGCDYECKADDMIEISSFTHRTNQDLYLRHLKRKAS